MENHKDLLDKWSMEPRHLEGGFIRDGIIDPVLWGTSPRKVLLLLKEAYDGDGGKQGYDLCKWIREEWKGAARYAMWNKAARWCQMVQTLENPKSLEDISAEEANRALLSSAVVNVKKSNGEPSSDHGNLSEYAISDKEYIKKQIQIINPEIVICGYTWEYVRDFWPSDKVSDLVYFADGRIFIDYWHPANQYPHKLNYYAFAFLLQQAQRTKPQLFTLPLNNKPGENQND